MVSRLSRAMACKPGRTGAVLSALAAAACTPDRPPPPDLVFAGLPVTGDLAGARRAGFDRCVNIDAVNLRCRRNGIMIFGKGPFQAALDLRGESGESGFRHVTIWSDDDQRALYQVPVALAGRGWKFCYTGTDRSGDQAVFTHPDEPFVIHMDISYYGKRRIRIFPSGGSPELSSPCKPADNLSLFGLNTEI